MQRRMLTPGEPVFALQSHTGTNMAGEVTRRKELHDFLKAARARLQPEDLGLTPPRNRRSSGLQQADLAATLNVSPRWYNGFENGAAGANDEILDRIARILQLAPAERLHLYLLATEHGPAPGTIEPPHGAEAGLTRLVRQMGDLAIPAAVTDVAWNILAWNRALPAWFPDPGNVPLGDRNAILWAFTPEIDSIVADIDNFRQTYIGWVHLALAGHPDDPRLRHLVDRLQRIPAARQLWNTQQIAKFTDSITPVRFHLADSASLAETDLLSAEFPGAFRLLMLVPCGGWPDRPPSRTRVIGHSISQPAADPQPHP
jgi:transcriptional regulator with XRE-family HTH domain